ncbi:MAG: DUF4388 domain-containing protein, partial [Terriglobales bacterium]
MSALAGGPVTLAGDLSIVELANVLQSISLCKMTGRLNIYRKTLQAGIYFDSGTLMDVAAHNAVSGANVELDPEELLLDLLSSEGGTFRFQPGATTERRTVRRRLESFILEGATLEDYHNALKKRGFAMDATLIVNHKVAPEKVDETMRSGAPVNFPMQKEFYGKALTGARASDLIGVLPRSTWLPIIFNLVQTGLLNIATKGTSTQHHIETSLLSKALATRAFGAFCKPETGLLAAPVFFYFLEQEVVRHQKAKHACSLVLMNIVTVKDEVQKQDLEVINRCFTQIKQPYDHFAHFEEQGNKLFAMLLPYRTLPAAYLFIDNLIFTLRGTGAWARNFG